MTRTILTVVGARPQFVKAAALSRAIAATGSLREVMVHTGQHHDVNMSDVFFDELEIPQPTHRLGIHGGSHGAMTGRMLEGLEALIQQERPGAVLVYGDTNSTLAGALAAAKLNVPVCHVEAGLRSFNRTMPEEVNRVLTDHMSELLLCPTYAAVQNLAREGIVDGVHLTGDVMYDATLHALDVSRRRPRIAGTLGLQAGGFALATIHRASNTDDATALRTVVEWLKAQAAVRPVVLPLHPRTRQAADRFGISLDGLTVIDPVGYVDMAGLLADCVEVYTDSGGLQKEAYFHRKPCVTLRDETEWVETIEAGWNRLWTVADWLPQRDIPEYGTGAASGQIAGLLSKMPSLS